MIAGLEVARALDDEVEARVEGELLEEVVVDAGAGLDADPAGAVEPEPNRDPRLGRRAQVARAAPGRRRQPGAGRSRSRASASTIRSSSRLVADRDPDPVVVGAHDEPLAKQRLAERAAVLDRDEEEVRAGRKRRQPDRAAAPRRAARAPRAPGCTSGGEASAATRERGRERRDRARAPGARSARRRCRARRARSRRGRRRAQRPSRSVRSTMTPSSSSGTAVSPTVLEVGLVADERPGVGKRRAAAPSGLFGRHVKVTARARRPRPRRPRAGRRCR